MRVLIAGGGIAGTVAALAAQKAGFDPVIFEAYPESAGLDQGLFLTLAVNGLDALRAVDAAEVVTEAGFPTPSMRFFSGTGKALGDMTMGPETDGLVAHSIRRADLYRGLAALARDRGIPTVHGERLTSSSPLLGGRVRATFTTRAEDGDVLVGADGVHSTARSLISADNPAPRYLGMGNTGGFVAPVAGIDAGTPGEYRMVWGRNCFFGSVVAPDREIWWFANPLSREPVARGTSGPATRAHLIELFEADRFPAAAIIRAGGEDVSITDQHVLATVPAWHDATTVIIGDAAHAVSPTSGQGASLAAEDGVILMQCLRDRAFVPEALAAFTALRRPRVERIARESARMNSTKMAGPLTRAIRDAMMPIGLRAMSSPRQQAKQDWLHRHHISWAGQQR